MRRIGATLGMLGRGPAFSGCYSSSTYPKQQGSNYNPRDLQAPPPTATHVSNKMNSQYLVLSLLQSSDLPHPAGALLLSFVNEALDPNAAASYVLEACHASQGLNPRSELLSLVHDWTYIVESSESNRLRRNPPPPTKVTMLITTLPSFATRPSSASTRPCRPPSHHPW